MKTRLLKKLRKKADNIYSVMEKNGRFNVVAYDPLYDCAPFWNVVSEHLTLEGAKTECKLVKIDYILKVAREKYHSAA